MTTFLAFQVKIWCTKQEGSVLNIDMKTNICCVKYNPESSKFVAVHHLCYPCFSYPFEFVVEFGRTCGSWRNRNTFQERIAVAYWMIHLARVLTEIYKGRFFHISAFIEVRHVMQVGSADHHIHYYDLRNPCHPVCVFTGHQKAVSYVKFLSSNELASASTDSTLRLWDVKDNLLVSFIIACSICPRTISAICHICVVAFSGPYV